MQDEPARIAPPQNKIVVTRYVGTVERYATIFGHWWYSVLTGLIILTTNTLLAFLDNVRQYLGSLWDVPNNVDDEITYRNDLFIEQMEQLERESERTESEPEPTEDTK